MTIDPSKTYRTRDGRSVRIFATDGGGDFPILGAVFVERGQAWLPESWTASGRLTTNYDHHPRDLVEVKPRITWERWVNVYGFGPGQLHATHYSARQEALTLKANPPLACVRVIIDCEKGEGLEGQPQQ